MSQARRVKRLEIDSGGEREVTHAEWVFWSMRPEEWRRSNDPENLDFIRRWEKSKVRRLVKSLKRSA